MKAAKPGIKFKNLREYSRYSQQQMAEYLSVNQSVISGFEVGERGMSVDTLEKACELFGCTLSDFYKADTEIRSGIAIVFVDRDC